MRRPCVLSVAGSDPSGGAGIQADLKTFFALDVYGMAVLTSLTAQNTRGVTGIHDVPPEFVGAQLAAVFDDIEVAAVKTGMLKTVEIIRVVAGTLADRGVRSLVVDPVMVATSGDRLVDEAAVAEFRRALFPLAALVTPNRAEAAVLADRAVEDLSDAGAAARVILETGAGAVLVKGIPRGEEMADLLVTPEGESVHALPALPGGPTHGSGCTLSSALAARLARGDTVPGAVEHARAFVWRAIRDAYPVGGGAVPLNHHATSEEGL